MQWIYSDDFELTIIDNGSSEANTKDVLSNFDCDYKGDVIFLNDNISIHRTWNWFAEKTDYEFKCFLNNDILLHPNFVEDTIKIMDDDPDIGCVAHASNHPNYTEMITDGPAYVSFNGSYRQGWDFTMRNDAYTKIPEVLKFFCGDDFLYENLYANEYRFAISLSSPIIHYCARTPRIPGISNADIANYKKLGYNHPNLDVNRDFNVIRPDFNNPVIKELEKKLKDLI